MSSRITTIATAVAATLAMSLAASDAQAQDENWSFEIAPYLWAAGIDTDITIGDHTANVERSFSDIAESLDIGGGLMAGARIGHFVAVTQIDYLKLDSDLKDDAPERGRLESDVLMAMLAVGYRFERSRAGAHTDLLIGARQLSLDNTLTLDGLGKFEGDKDYVDPIVMLRPSFPLGNRWRFNPDDLLRHGRRLGEDLGAAAAVSVPDQRQRRPAHRLSQALLRNRFRERPQQVRRLVPGTDHRHRRHVRRLAVARDAARRECETGAGARTGCRSAAAAAPTAGAAPAARHRRRQDH